MKNFREKVEGTKTFQQLNKVQKALTVQKTNISHLEHGVNVAKNIGLDKWKKTSITIAETSVLLKKLLLIK